MNLINYAQLIEPMQDQFARIYSTMSGIIGVLLVLWILNFIAGLIHRTYMIGRAFGSFYRNYLHKYIKAITLQVLSLFRIRRFQSSV